MKIRRFVFGVLVFSLATQLIANDGAIYGDESEDEGNPGAATAAPKISGTYIFSRREDCQAVFATRTINDIDEGITPFDVDVGFDAIAVESCSGGCAGAATSVQSVDHTGSISGVTHTDTLANVVDEDVNDGKLEELAGTATFDASTHIISFSGFQATGTAVIVQGLSPISDTMALAPYKDLWTYSNTDSTITIKGATYQAFYAMIVNGVAHYVTFLGLNNDPSQAQGCRVYGTAVRH